MYTLLFLNILSLFTIANSQPLNKTDVFLTCPDYVDVENGNVQSIESETSISYQILHVECDMGFDLVGHSKIVCKKGEWYPPERPKCVKRCDPPPSIDKGMMKIEHEKDQFGKYAKGTLVTYSCNSGYELSPTDSRYRVCEMGIWTGSQAFCVRQVKFGCKKPKDIKNGYFVLENGLLENSYDVGQRIHYSCNSDYVLLGDTVQLCLDDGSWSPRIPPTCEKMDVGPGLVVDLDGGNIGEEVLHGTLNNINNGISIGGVNIDNIGTGGGSSILSSRSEGIPQRQHICDLTALPNIEIMRVVRGSLTTNSLADVGTEVEVQCRPGFRDERRPCSPPEIIRCLSPGHWEGFRPHCVAVKSCRPPPTITNGTLFKYITNSDQQSDSIIITGEENNEVDGIRDSLPSRYPIGFAVAYKCLPGYQSRGFFIFTCEKSGCWRPDTLPVCVPDRQFLEDYMSTSGTVLVSLATAAGVMIVVLLAMCSLVACRRRKPWLGTGTVVGGGGGGVVGPAGSVPPATRAALMHDPDRLALIAFADGIQVNGQNQSGLPSYEEAVRDRSGAGGFWACRPHRSYWPGAGGRRSRGAPNGDIMTRQSSCTSHSALSIRSGGGGMIPSNLGGGGLGVADPMGSTDTMTPSEVSTTVTLDTVSSHTCSSGSQVAGSCRAICGSLASFDTTSVHNTEGVPLLEENELEDATSPTLGHVMEHSSVQPPAADNASFKFRHTAPDMA